VSSSLPAEISRQRSSLSLASRADEVLPRAKPNEADRLSLHLTPAFRAAWKKGQRCLVVTDGFYEWKKRTPAQNYLECLTWQPRSSGDARNK
jgi:SOS response associated peptidase (SRAP)